MNMCYPVLDGRVTFSSISIFFQAFLKDITILFAAKPSYCILTSSAKFIPV